MEEWEDVGEGEGWKETIIVRGWECGNAHPKGTPDSTLLPWFRASEAPRICPALLPVTKLNSLLNS